MTRLALDEERALEQPRISKGVLIWYPLRSMGKIDRGGIRSCVAQVRHWERSREIAWRYQRAYGYILNTGWFCRRALVDANLQELVLRTEYGLYNVTGENIAGRWQPSEFKGLILLSTQMLPRSTTERFWFPDASMSLEPHGSNWISKEFLAGPSKELQVTGY